MDTSSFSIFPAANSPLRAKSGDLRFQLPAWKRSPVIMDRSPISTRPGCGLCTYTPYPHLRLCMHHHISFRPKLAIVHSDTAGLQHEATLAIRQPFCFSSIAAIISSIMSISSKSSGCLKSSQVATVRCKTGFPFYALDNSFYPGSGKGSQLLL